MIPFDEIEQKENEENKRIWWMLRRKPQHLKTSESHLQFFEKNVLWQVLKDLKTAEVDKIWNSEINNKGLFDYWLKIKSDFVGMN